MRDEPARSVPCIRHRVHGFVCRILDFGRVGATGGCMNTDRKPKRQPKPAPVVQAGMSREELAVVAWHALIASGMYPEVLPQFLASEAFHMADAFIARSRES